MHERTQPLAKFFKTVYNVGMERKTNQIYVKTPLSTVFNVRAIYTVHYFRYAQLFEFEGESHPFWEFVYIDSGSASVIADGRRFDMKQGDAYFHKPNEFHTIKTDDKFANSVIISFDCVSPAMHGFENCRVNLDRDEKALLAKIVDEASKCFSDKLGDVYLKKLTRAKDQPFGGEQLIRLYVEQLLISLTRRRESPPERESKEIRSTEELTEKIKRQLEEHVYDTISLDEIAANAFFSKTYVKAVFKKNTGTTIMQYFTRLKIDEAKKLISMNKYTFTEIAYKLGYSSLYYFSRQFKKCTTMTLSEYSGSIKMDKIL